MIHRVIMLPKAEGDFDGLYRFIAQRSPAGAANWANAFYRALKSLETNALVHGLAPEDDDHEVEIRQIFFRTRQGNNYALSTRSKVRMCSCSTCGDRDKI